MVPEKIKCVLHSDDKIDRLSLCGFRVRSNTHAPLALDYIHDLRFSIRNEVRFKFSRYQNEISYQNENFIWIEKRNDLSWKEMLASVSSFLYHVNNPQRFFKMPQGKYSVIFPRSRCLKFSLPNRVRSPPYPEACNCHLAIFALCHDTFLQWRSKEFGTLWTPCPLL